MTYCSTPYGLGLRTVSEGNVEAFRYRGFELVGNSLLRLGGILIVAVSTGGGCLLMAASLQLDPPYWEAACWLLWLLLVGWLAGLTMINAYPTVWLDAHHLYISAFLFTRIAIPWSDVLDVKLSRGVAGNLGHTLVRAKRITPFHRIYGWMHARTLSPGFLIGRDIDRHDELIREIRIRAGVTL